MTFNSAKVDQFASKLDLAAAEAKGRLNAGVADDTMNAIASVRSDDFDLASLSESLDVQVGLDQLDAQKLQRIGEVRDAIREQSFGVCADCGGKIPQERINALQGLVLRCVGCQTKSESAEKAHQYQASDFDTPRKKKRHRSEDDDF